MKEVVSQLQRVEAKFLEWAEYYSYSVLRVSIGMVYALFGGLKFFPSHSPAGQVAVDTIEKLSTGLLSGNAALLSLAALETGLGLCLIFRWRLRLAVYVAVGHMLGTFFPLFFFPEQAFTGSPLSLSLLGQYIFKNAVIVGALLVVYAKSARRQGKVVTMAVLKEADSINQQEGAHALHQEKQRRKQLVPASR